MGQVGLKLFQSFVEGGMKAASGASGGGAKRPKDSE
jgi:hypothetical protein